jgi:hypothetical protein
MHSIKYLNYTEVYLFPYVTIFVELISINPTLFIIQIDRQMIDRLIDR